MVGIYKITSPSGKIYIGQSVEIERRFNSYKRMYVKNKGVVKLYRSFLKYGVDNHIFEVVCECEESQLNEKERYYQEMFDCI
jgi:group I intron endonuclease